MLEFLFVLFCFLSSVICYICTHGTKQILQLSVLVQFILKGDNSLKQIEEIRPYTPFLSFSFALHVSNVTHPPILKREAFENF